MKPRNGFLREGKRRDLLLDDMVVSVSGKVLEAGDYPDQFKKELFMAATVGLGEAVGLIGVEVETLMPELLMRMSLHGITVSKLTEKERESRMRAIEKKYRRIRQ